MSFSDSPEVYLKGADFFGLNADTGIHSIVYTARAGVEGVGGKTAGCVERGFPNTHFLGMAIVTKLGLTKRE